MDKCKSDEHLWGGHHHDAYPTKLAYKYKCRTCGQGGNFNPETGEIEEYSMGVFTEKKKADKVEKAA